VIAPVKITGGRLQRFQTGDVLDNQFLPLNSFTVDFTDGDTLRRVTVTDANVKSTSHIFHSISRPNVADSADPGFLYILNIVNVQNGSFDALIACLDWGFGDPVETPPNETITVTYLID